MNRTAISETIQYLGRNVKVSGWVHARRDHGKIIFIDLRDRSGLLQLVFSPQNGEIYKAGETLRSEWVIEVEGKIQKRPKGMENSKLPTGELELSIEKITVLNEAKTPPFEISEEKNIGEDIRLTYRYLDLRRERMKQNILFRHRAVKFIRDFMDGKGFVEVETPILTKSTPEGARDFLVPSRIHPGTFFALPQAPQQLKQLLMVAGLEKYFQIARCFRDEDLRGDRQPEFTQLDIEASFVTREDVTSFFEELIIGIVETVTQKELSAKPFPRITYEESMEKHKTDKPDLRKDKNNPNELAFCWIVDWPLFEWNKGENRWDPVHHVFTAPQEQDLEKLANNPGSVKSWQYDLVLNGHEVAGGSIRNHKPEAQNKIFELVGLKKEDVEKKFSHLLEALEYGAPPHGGIAMGIERFLMVVLGESSIREVMAFPKSGDGSDLMMGAPSPVEPEQLKDLGIKLEK